MIMWISRVQLVPFNVAGLQNGYHIWQLKGTMNGLYKSWEGILSRAVYHYTLILAHCSVNRSAPIMDQET